MVSKIQSFALLGIDAIPIEVEATLNKGLPMFDIVGLPDAAVRESRERVKSAIINSGFNFPTGRIVINLAPADIKKEGVIYDLPILLSVLNISGVDLDINNCAFVGEVSLSGELRSIKGVLPMAIKAKEKNYKKIFVPKQNANEAAVIKGIDVIAVSSVYELVQHLQGKQQINPSVFSSKNEECIDILPDFCEVKGQEAAKRAIEVAVAGGHNILMVGPPGSGKSMLAKRIPSILPQMTFDEMIETTKIYSVSGILRIGTGLLQNRPFRAPHHTISPYGLVGGGSNPKPGEISLAHNGVLFLDELPEFGRNTMEALRQPLEDKMVTISRVNSSLTYPCSFILVAAMNPCPCGYYGHPSKSCTCSNYAVSNYMSKISGPLLDRFDIHIHVPAVEFEKLDSDILAESSQKIRHRICKAREIQRNRFENASYCNADLNDSQMKNICKIGERGKKLLKQAFQTLGMSARAYNKILKVSRTIADIENSIEIQEKHIMEALQYRTPNFQRTMS